MIAWEEPSPTWIAPDSGIPDENWSISHPINENPVILEMLDDTAQVRVQAPGQTFDFETTLPYYYIKTFTDACLVVRQNSFDYNTPVVLDSLLIGVAP